MVDLILLNLILPTVFMCLSWYINYTRKKTNQEIESLRERYLDFKREQHRIMAQIEKDRKPSSVELSVFIQSNFPDSVGSWDREALREALLLLVEESSELEKRIDKIEDQLLLYLDTGPAKKDERSGPILPQGSSLKSEGSGGN